MGLLDKLKNVFFEEEYIEVEEPVKKEKVVPVAKKIETPEAKKAKEEALKMEKELEEVEVKEVEKTVEKDFRFPMDFDEKDFEVEEKKKIETEKKIEEVPVVREEEPVYQEKVVYRETVYQEKPVYQEKKVYQEKPVYQEKTVYKEKKEFVDETSVDYRSVNYQGLYEGSERKEKKNTFKPSPIISPIYGVLDKNYKKEEIVTKKEVRLSVASAKKVDLDSVREKAYGDLANDITESIHEEVREEVTPIDENNLLYDLNDDESPAVKVVTMGDAEEYFTDLGLEYNVDYKVEREIKEEVEKPVARRTDRKRNVSEVDDDMVRSKAVDTKKTENSNNDSNLFDLIDSMYEDKE